MATYQEIRNKYGKERAEEMALEQGFSSSQIAKESNEYEMVEAVSAPQVGLSNVMEKIKKDKAKVTKVNFVQDVIKTLDDILFSKIGDEPKSEIGKAAEDIANSDIGQSAETGLKESVLYKGYKYVTGGEYNPPEFQPQTTTEKAVAGVTSVLADTPVFAASAIPGAATGSPFAAGVTSFAGHSYLNSYLSQELQNDWMKREKYVAMLREGMVGDLDTAIDLALQYKEENYEHDHWQDIKEGIKGGVTGAAMGYVGGKAHKLTSKLLDSKKAKQLTSNLSFKEKAVIRGATHSTAGTAAEIATLGTVPPLLDARVPTTEDYVDGAMIIAGLKLTKVHKTMDQWEKGYKREELRKWIKEAELDFNAVNSTSPFTTPTERMVLAKEGQSLIEKAQKQDRGLTQGDIEEALQLEYIKSGKTPIQVVEQISSNKKEFQDFVSLANDIMSNGGLDNVLRDPVLREKHLPKVEFEPVVPKEEEIGSVKDVKNPELFVGPRNGKLESGKKLAEDLLNEGKKTREEIRQETGWDIIDVKTETGENKRFYIFEISDANSKLVIDVNNIKNHSKYTLGQVFEHEPLYELYPWLKNVRVEFSKGDRGHEGSFNPRSLTFWFNTMYVKDPVEFRKTIIHEVQHIIQGYEQWAAGGSPQYSNPVLPESIKAAYEERSNLVPFLKEGLKKEGFDVTYVNDRPHSLDVWRWEMEKIAQRDPVYAESYNRFMELLQTTDVYEAKLSFGRYLRLWGENQARNASRRSDYTPEMIKAISPEMTQDFPTGTTIVKIRDAIYPKGDFIPNAKNKSILYSRADKMEVYVGWKEAGTYEPADRLGDIVTGLTLDVANIVGNRKSVFKEKMTQGQNTRGVFYVDPEFIRVRENSNISVVSHELAHNLEKSLVGMGKFFPDTYRAELKKIATPGKVKSEGFAELLSWYLINPSYAEKTVPNAYKYFKERMAKDFPKTFKILNKYQKKIRDYQEQPSYAAIVGAMTDRAQQGIDTVFNWQEIEYTSLVDDIYPIKVYEDVVLSKMTPEDKAVLIGEGKLPYQEARLTRGIAGTVATYIDGEPVDFSGKVIKGKDGKPLKNLIDITKGMSKKEFEEFNAYLFAKRVVEVKDKRLDDVQTPIDPNHARSEVDRLAPKYEAKAQEIYNMMDALLKYSADGNLISQDTYTKLREMYPNYIPMVPVKNYTAPGGKTLKADKAIKSLRGNDNPILLPILGIEDYINRVIINSQRNRVLTLMADLSDLPGAGAFVRKIKESGRNVKLPEGSKVFKETRPEDPLGIIGMDPFTGDILGIYRDKGDQVYVLTGERPNEFKVRRGDSYELYAADPMIIDAIKGIHNIVQDKGKVVNTIKTVIKYPAKATRWGATAKPTWMLRNLIIDQGTSAINSEHNYIAGYDAVIGLGNVLFDTKKYRDWKASGGSQSSFYSLRTDGKYYKMLDKYHQEGWGDKLWNVAKSPFELWNSVGELSDNMTRVGEFINARRDYLKEGISPEKASRRAAFDSRDMTMDFSRGGRGPKSWNEFDAFFNAEIQGNDKFLRTIKEHPVKSSILLGGITMGFLLNEYAHEHDEEYQGLSDYIHDTHIVFRNSEGLLVKIPIPRELAMLKNLSRRVYHNEFRGMFDDVGSAAVDMMIPDALRLVVEPTANYSFFRQQPVIPAYLESEVGEYQFTNNTTETAKHVAKLFRDLGLEDTNILTSPMMVENIASNISGGLLFKLFQGLDTFYATDKIDPYEDEKGLFNSTFYVMATPSNNKYVHEYFEILKDLKKNEKAYKRDYKEKGETSKEREDKYFFLMENMGTVGVISAYSQQRSDIIGGKIKFQDKEGNIDKDWAKEEVLQADKDLIFNATQFVKEYRKRFK